jgi:hypothetical protein
MLPASIQPIPRDLLAILLTAPLFWLTGQIIMAAILLAIAAAVIWLFFAFRSRGESADPRVGQVWWAKVPYEEDAETYKIRPIVIKSVRPGAVVAFYVTSQNKDDRPGFLRLACESTGDEGRKQSWAEYGKTRTIPEADVLRYGATLPPHEFRRLCDGHANSLSTRA